MNAVDAPTLKAWLSDGSEIALLDVREPGQHGAGHPLFAVPLPYSRFELGLKALVPNPGARLVLLDENDGTAARAASRAQAIGYRNAHIVDGGAPAWAAAGYTLFAGVNVPSKTFGELIELERHTPRVSPRELEAMRRAREDLVIVDGRPLTEYRRMNIPGGICCPNGELALRIAGIAPDPKTKIVVNCAGRTRSIIGAQILIDFGVPNPVYALENGTQGWFLAGLKLERGADRHYREGPPSGGLADLTARADAFAARCGAAPVDAATARSWIEDRSRTTYCVDVRTPEEFAARAAPGFRHAPGGQLLQATDLWIGVKGARILLADDDGVRAPVVAGWLRRLGHEAYALAGGLAAAQALKLEPMDPPPVQQPAALSPRALAAAVEAGRVQIIDLRPSASFRERHIAGSVWSIRPRIAAALGGSTKPLVLVADEPDIAALAALDLAEAGCNDVRTLAGGMQAWCDAGLPVVATPDEPADEARIDFLFFVHARHDGNADAARQYLAWETALPDQLDAAERAVFRVSL